MAMQSESYEAHEPSEQPASRARPRRAAPRAVPPPAPARRHPDEEAMLLMMKVVERVEVAKSFAKIATGIVAGVAANAAVQLRAAADAKMVAVVEREGGLKSRLDRVRKIAKAATDAAVHVATHKPEPSAPEPEPAEET
jgi:hypothetical protein